MNIEKIKEIIELNNKFYKKHAEEFSKTRQNPWPGWSKLLDPLQSTFSDYQKVSVLDIGCGNGRFYAFLSDFIDMEIDYLGLDNNDYFLIEALLKYPTAQFKNFNIFLDINNIESTYDLIVSFGVTHHLPGKEFRLNWYEKISKLVNKNGLLIFTFWNIKDDQRFEKAIKAKDLEKNDYYYGWGSSNDKRYVHVYSKKEVENLAEIFKQNNLKLEITYESDGKNNLLNTYLVLKSS